MFGRQRNIAIGAEITEKSLLVSDDLGPFCPSEHLDHVALLRNTLFKNERIKRKGICTCSDVFVRDVRSVEHQKWMMTTGSPSTFPTANRHGVGHRW